MSLEIKKKMEKEQFKEITMMNVCKLLTITVHLSVNNKHFSTVTCSLDHLAHVTDVTVQPIKDADQAGDGFFAELHAVLEVQS